MKLLRMRLNWFCHHCNYLWVDMKLTWSWKYTAVVPSLHLARLYPLSSLLSNLTPLATLTSWQLNNNVRNLSILIFSAIVQVAQISWWHSATNDRGQWSQWSPLYTHVQCPVLVLWEPMLYWTMLQIKNITSLLLHTLHVICVKW